MKKSDLYLTTNLLLVAVSLSFLCLFPVALFSQENTGVLGRAEERAGQEPETSLHEVLCESYRSLGIRPDDIPAVVKNCEQFRDLLPLIEGMNSPEVQRAYRQLSEAVEDSGLAGSVDVLLQKARDLEVQKIMRHLPQLGIQK